MTFIQTIFIYEYDLLRFVPNQVSQVPLGLALRGYENKKII